MGSAFLAVARFRKPHGLKGEAVCSVLTDDPEQALAAGASVTPVDEEGRPVAPALVIERSRPYHRQWLLKFRDIDERTPLEAWHGVLLGVPEERLRPPAGEEAYVHELPGMAAVVNGEVIGHVRELLDVRAGNLLVLDVEGREVLVPFRREIVRRVDRAARRVEIDPPEGLLEL